MLSASRREGGTSMEPMIDHIEITVRDMATAVPFYDRLLPLLGSDLRNRSSAIIERHNKHVVSYEHPRLGLRSHRREAPSPVRRSIAASRERSITLRSGPGRGSKSIGCTWH